MRLIKRSEIIDIENISERKLAYIGDCIFELYMREFFFNADIMLQKMHDRVISVVNAQFQCYIVKNIELTEDEQDFVRRIRNKKIPVPKGIKPSHYKYSTAFEALLGKLYLEDNDQRLYEIIEAVIKIIQERE